MAVAVAGAVGGEGRPRSAQALLEAAYGAEFGKTGHALAGHTVIDAADVQNVIEKGQGSSLLYGELLPEGVAALIAALFVDREAAPGPVLELGMGTGKVALQFFLTLHRDVYGVELAPSRWQLADDALRKLASLDAARFHYERSGECSSRLVDSVSSVTCDFVCGSLLDTPTDLLRTAAAVVMEVCLPKEVQKLACALLQNCASGCRAVCYAPLHGLVDDCKLGPVRLLSAASDAAGDGAGGLSLAASWRPLGHGFAFYRVTESVVAAQAAWAEALGERTAARDRVEVDASGCPSRARRTRYTDDVLPSPRCKYPFGKGDKVLVGYSWLPFLDLGNPGDGSAGGLDGVTWMEALIVSVNDQGFATICYSDDGTVEEKVHPERIRQPQCLEARPPVDINWGDEDGT